LLQRGKAVDTLLALAELLAVAVGIASLFFFGVRHSDRKKEEQQRSLSEAISEAQAAQQAKIAKQAAERERKCLH
jgi:hypothetical protein